MTASHPTTRTTPVTRAIPVTPATRTTGPRPPATHHHGITGTPTTGNDSRPPAPPPLSRPCR
ncbi:hypothetical protein [Streptomyces sp. NPDC090994]|uniref:hypothetical protein n=1 Tax=Streptomyces sp. NPDC090994 TaxID=3365969 RepID=UPI0037FD87E9